MPNTPAPMPPQRIGLAQGDLRFRRCRRETDDGLGFGFDSVRSPFASDLFSEGTVLLATATRTFVVVVALGKDSDLGGGSGPRLKMALSVVRAASYSISESA